ncbi:MAG: DUF1269 domain-containing protein [Anaerolineales bacterium]
MAALTVWQFDSVDGAVNVLNEIDALVKQQTIEVRDAAIVEWPEGRNKPKTRQAVSVIGGGALSGSFWGMLFGLIFFVPLFGMAVGAAVGALSGMFTDYGIDDDFIKSVREEITEGTSALFLLTGDMSVDRVHEALKGKMGTLIRSNLSNEQQEKLQAAFGEE